VTINKRLDAPAADPASAPVESELTVTRKPRSWRSVSWRSVSWRSVSWRSLPWLRIAAWLGVLLPLALLIKQAWVSAPDFDGSMNLQVAQNFAHGHGFSRDYITGQGGVVNLAKGTTLFPHEIQTTGVYLFLAAGLIKIFGSSTIVFQLPNLLFLLLLMVFTSIALRRWPIARIIGPTLVIFAVPSVTLTALGGYGEYVVGALVIGSFVLLGEVATGGRRPLWTVFGASVLMGLALTVKIVAFIALPVFAIGLVGLLVVRPGGEKPLFRRALLVPVAIVGGALPLAAVEVQRLISLGSVAAFKRYWHQQFTSAQSQAGVAGTGQGTAATDKSHGLQKVADHFHLLSVATGINSAVLLIALVTPFVALVGLFLYRRMAWREWLAKPGALLSIVLAGYAGGYLAWWLAVTPTAKTWLRRVIIALAVVVLLALVLVGMAKDRYLERRSLTAEPSPRRTLVARVVWGIVAVLAVISVIPAVTTTQFEAEKSWDTNGTIRDHLIDLAAQAKKLHEQGDVLYAGDFLSAPTVALYGDLPLVNLATFPGFTGQPVYCDPAAGIATGKAYYIWDLFNIRLADRSSSAPVSLFFDFTPLPGGSAIYGTIYKISVKKTVTDEYRCPASS
jgi:hypothetical protein